MTTHHDMALNTINETIIVARQLAAVLRRERSSIEIIRFDASMSLAEEKCYLISLYTNNLDSIRHINKTAETTAAFDELQCCSAEIMSEAQHSATAIADAIAGNQRLINIIDNIGSHKGVSPATQRKLQTPLCQGHR